MQELAWGHVIGKKTVSVIIKETTKLLWEVLQPLVLQPSSKEKWEDISLSFYRRWNMPNCLGAVDGKHVALIDVGLVEVTRLRCI